MVLETDPTDTPVSLYAATKNPTRWWPIPMPTCTACRPPASASLPIWPGRAADMAYFGFTKAIVEGTPIQVFNEGQLERDFTYIDDIVSGVVAAAAAPPVDLEVRYRLLNLGNHQPVKLGDFIATLEVCWARDANKQLVGMQPGDVYRTAANIDAARALVGFEPSTDLGTGLERFVAWYRDYYQV
ncbi:MAG: hypothetical protein CM15mP74_36790 [Halieaceae bacterium]|nr:MAG: hypothetical protein CM15mP74_36790 [Halieaceae bacterium]